MSEAIDLVNYETRDNWLASRVNALGASEVAALFNDGEGRCLSPFTTPYVLWLEKTGRQDPQELTGEWVQLGNLLEPTIAAIYTERTGRRVWQGGPFCVAQHPTIPYLRATPDRWVIEAHDRGSPGLLQLKMANAFKAHNWDDGPPDFIEIQVQAEMAVTGREWDSVATLIGGGTAFGSWDVERNDGFIAEMYELAREFWARVEARTPPPIDSSLRTLAAIKRLHPSDNNQAVRLPEESVEWLDILEKAKSDAKVAEELKTKAESKIRAAVGDATFGLLPDGRRVSLKTTERKAYTSDVAGTTYRTLRIEKKPMKGASL